MTLAEGGIDLFIPETYDIVWSLIILVIVAVFFYKFFMPKFNAIFDERAAKIQGNIAKAEQAKKDADEAKAKYEAQLSTARVDAAKIRDDARAEASHIIADARSRAESDAAQIAASAQRSIESQHQQAIVSLKGEVGALCHRSGRQDPWRQAGRQRRAVLDDRFDDRRSGRQEVTVTIRNQKGEVTMRGEASRIADRESRDSLAPKLRDTREDAWRIGNELFTITKVLDDSIQLERALTDPSRPVADKVAVLKELLGDNAHPMTMEIMTDLVSRRWSRARDIANAVEDFGVDAMMYYATPLTPRCRYPSSCPSCIPHC